MKLGKGGQYVVHIGYKYGRAGMKAYASRKFLLSFATVASATALVYVGAIADGGLLCGSDCGSRRIPYC